MTCKVNGDLTGSLVQHDDYDHSDEKQQISPGFLKHIQGLGLQTTPLFLLAIQLTRRQIQLVVWVWQRERVSHFSCVFFSPGFKETS